MVQPEFDPPSVAPLLSEVAAAYSDVVAYNHKHTGVGRGIVNVMMSIFEAQEQLGPDASIDEIHSALEKREESASNPTVEADMTADLTRIMHGDVLEHAGIGLAKSGITVVSGTGNRMTGDPLTPVIERSEVFKDFLTGINPDEAEDKTSADMLLTLARNLRNIIIEATTIVPEDSVHVPAYTDVADDHLGLWTEIAPEYKRLGLGESNTYQSLEELVEYWGRDILPEFLTATKAGYLQTPDSPYFSPAKWASDMNPQGLTERWEAAADFIEDLMARGKDAEFTGAVRANMKTSLDVSIAEMERSEEESKGLYEIRLAQWKEHGEEPYWEKSESGNISRTKPEKEAYDSYTQYYKNNRLALQTARLRFQSL